MLCWEHVQAMWGTQKREGASHRGVGHTRVIMRLWDRRARGRQKGGPEGRNSC